MLSPERTNAARWTCRYAAVLAVALVAFLSVACQDAERVDIVALRILDASGADAKSEASAADSEPLDANNEASGNDADICGTAGPSEGIRVGDTLCSQGGARYFQHALCVCDGYSVNENLSGPQLVTDVFNSSLGDPDKRSSGGSVGINNLLSVTGPLELKVGGSLIVARTADPGIWLASGAKLTVGQNLEVQTAVRGAEVIVEGDARVGGEIRLASLTVNGTLTTPLELSSPYNIVGGTKQAPVSVTAPCECNSQPDIGNISLLVAQHASDPKRTGGLGNYEDGRIESFSCGRYYLPELSGSGKLTLKIAGRVALYVAASVANLAGTVLVELDPGAELDLFFAGDLVTNGRFTFGSKNGAGRARLYVGGTTLNLNGENFLAGYIFAPNANFVFTGQTEVFGSVFVKKVDPTNNLIIHYDSNPIVAGNGSACGN
jgi:hypothetical protein